MCLLCSDGEEEQVPLLVALAEHGLHPVDALAELGRDLGLGLLQVLHQGALAGGDAEAQVVDEDGAAPAELGRGQGGNVVGLDGGHGFWKKKGSVIQLEYSTVPSPRIVRLKNGYWLTSAG